MLISQQVRAEDITIKITKTATKKSEKTNGSTEMTTFYDQCICSRRLSILNKYVMLCAFVAWLVSIRDVS